MKSMEELIHTFMMDLHQEGFTLPTDIYFPKKSWEKIIQELEIKSRYLYNGPILVLDGPIDFHAGMGSVRLWKTKESKEE